MAEQSLSDSVDPFFALQLFSAVCTIKLDMLTIADCLSMNKSMRDTQMLSIIAASPQDSKRMAYYICMVNLGKEIGSADCNSGKILVMYYGKKFDCTRTIAHHYLLTHAGNPSNWLLLSRYSYLLFCIPLDGGILKHSGTMLYIICSTQAVFIMTGYHLSNHGTLELHCCATHVHSHSFSLITHTIYYAYNTFMSSSCVHKNPAPQ